MASIDHSDKRNRMGFSKAGKKMMEAGDQQAEHERLGRDVAHQRSTLINVYRFFCKMLYPAPEFPNRKKDLIFFAIATRNLETVNAIRVLVDHQPSMLDDAGSLVRILAEATINAAFIAISDESMAERFDTWGDYYQAVQELRSLSAFPKTTSSEQKKAEDEWNLLKDQARKEFPDMKDSDFWKNLFERTKKVDEFLGNTNNGDHSKLLDTWRLLSNYVHQNALAVRKRIHEIDLAISGREYTEADKASVLYACNQALFAFCMIFDLVYWQAKHSDEWNKLCHAWRPYSYTAPE